MTKTYRLKAMVLVRALSEVTLFVILIALPIALQMLGKFSSLSITGRIVFITLAVIGAALLPWYGFITWKVVTDPLGITSVSVFKKQTCPWSVIKSLSRRSSWNWLRYVVEGQYCEVTFPVLLKNCDDLIQEIRQHLPAGAPSHNPYRRFEHDNIAAIWQVAQAFYGFIFIGLIWGFFNSVHMKTTANSDWMLVLAFCIIATVIGLWRTFVVALMPRWVQVTEDKLVLRTYFFEKSLPWDQLRSIKPASPFLPEGFMIKTHSGSYLVGSNMNAADELQDILAQKIQAPEQVQKM